MSSSQKTKGSTSHRLRRKDLVLGVLYRFSEVFESSQKETIWDIAISVEEIQAHLKERFGVEYNSSQWIFTQLRRYEDEIGARLFEKRSSKTTKDVKLALYPRMLEFVQKQHLHVPQKIRAANGVYDKINSLLNTSPSSRRTRVFLGAGSTMYHLANIFIERQLQDARSFTLHTHNAGVLPILFSQQVDHSRIDVSVCGGILDPVTHTLLGNPETMLGEKEFDFIIQGTSRISKGNLYIESRKEQLVKAAILHGCRGCKILVLTKHEFNEEPIEGVQPYGKLTDYDYIIVPRTLDIKTKKKYELQFDSYMDLFEPEILNWNYCIFKVRKQPETHTSQL